MITIRLNEVDHTCSRGATARPASTRSRNANSRTHLRFLFPCEDTKLDRRLEVRVFLGNRTIEVDASREWIVIDWQPCTLVIHSPDETQSQKMKIGRDRE
jgi:hypothetical protein